MFWNSLILALVALAPSVALAYHPLMLHDPEFQQWAFVIMPLAALISLTAFNYIALRQCFKRAGQALSLAPKALGFSLLRSAFGVVLMESFLAWVFLMMMAEYADKPEMKAVQLVGFSYFAVAFLWYGWNRSLAHCRKLGLSAPRMAWWLLLSAILAYALTYSLILWRF